MVLSTAVGVGTEAATGYIKKALSYWGVPYIKTYGIAVQAFNWEGVSEKKKARIRRDVERLAKTVSRREEVRPGLKTKFLFDLMRLNQKKGGGSSPEETDYWREQGWLDKGRPWKK